MILKEVSDVIGEYSGLSRKVLDYCQTVKHLVDAAKQPGFSAESWAPLGEFIAVDEFERIGTFKEVMTWPEYVGFLTGWAPNAGWECSFKRITETGNMVFLELEERSKMGTFESTVNSLTLYDFNPAGKVRNLHVYLQMEMPSGDMLKSYEGMASSS